MIASVRVATINSIAVTKKHDAMIASWRPVRSASKPPAGTETADSQSTMLIADPAAVIDQPRSTSIEGPKLKIMTKPMLYKAQINPAQTTAIAACRPRRPLDLVVPVEVAGERYVRARRPVATTISAATARFTALAP